MACPCCWLSLLLAYFALGLLCSWLLCSWRTLQLAYFAVGLLFSWLLCSWLTVKLACLDVGLLRSWLALQLAYFAAGLLCRWLTLLLAYSAIGLLWSWLTLLLFGGGRGRTGEDQEEEDDDADEEDGVHSKSKSPIQTAWGNIKHELPLKMPFKKPLTTALKIKRLPYKKVSGWCHWRPWVFLGRPGNNQQAPSFHMAGSHPSHCKLLSVLKGVAWGNQ